MTEINLFPKFFDNAISPVATNIGKTLSSVWNIVFGGIDLYSQKIEYKRILNLEQFKQELDNKVSSIPEEKLTDPPLHVLGPTLEASKFYYESSELRNMFSNLIASSINSDTISKVHPSFVEIIKQLNPDEAKIISLLKNDVSIPIIKIRSYDLENTNHFAEPLKEMSLLPYQAKCEHPELGPSYLINIARLGLADIDYSTYNILEGSYDELYTHPVVIHWNDIIRSLGKKSKILKGTFTRNAYGKKFYETCVMN